MTVVTQLVGTRRWRLAGIPDGDIPTLIPNHLDSNAFPWTPEHIIMLETGDIMIFPPGTVHDTLNLSPSQCAASITHQLGFPLPVKHYRAKMKSFLALADLREVWPRIVDLASFGFLRPRLSIESPFFETHPDLNPRTHLTYTENEPENFFRSVFSNFINTSDPLVGMFGNHLFMEYIAFHDTNDDGVIKEDEFVSTAMEWLRTELSIIQEIPAKFRLVRYFHSDMENVASREYWKGLEDWDVDRRYRMQNHSVVNTKDFEFPSIHDVQPSLTRHYVLTDEL
jgi:hypothetical protein